jgi:methionyl aminopeptidase
MTKEIDSRFRGNDTFMKPNIYSVEDIKKLSEGGYILSRILKYLLKMAQEQKTGDEIEKIAQKLIRESSGEPAFMEAKDEKGENYPAAICLSINEGVVHGIPYGQEIKVGDVVSIDIGLRYKGLVTDMAWTIYVEGKDLRIKQMLQQNEQALKLACKQAIANNQINNISREIEQMAKAGGFYPVAELSGHGVGKNLHEAPSIYNVPLENIKQKTLREGMVIAIEPIFALNSYQKLHFKDNWGIILPDNITSHFEFTVAVGAKPKILTPSPLA